MMKEEPAGQADAEWASVSTVFTNQKAGMEKMSVRDKNRVKQVIHEMSKDSAHQAEQQRKEVRCYLWRQRNSTRCTP